MVLYDFIYYFIHHTHILINFPGWHPPLSRLHSTGPDRTYVGSALCFALWVINDSSHDGKTQHVDAAAHEANHQAFGQTGHRFPTRLGSWGKLWKFRWKIDTPWYTYLRKHGKTHLFFMGNWKLTISIMGMFTSYVKLPDVTCFEVATNHDSECALISAKHLQLRLANWITWLVIVSGSESLS